MKSIHFPIELKKRNSKRLYYHLQVYQQLTKLSFSYLQPKLTKPSIIKDVIQLINLPNP